MIRKLLVANRGEIARRVQRTCRQLGIATVAVHSDPDAGALFVREADEAVSLGGSTPAESYLRADAVVAAAVAAGADAVHPGYGFLSEHAPFARAVADAGLVWVGPPPAAIEAMGSKLAARELMAGAGVPVLPGEDLTGVADADLGAVADRVGWPVLVKASAGGGGRGMRVVREPGDLVDAVGGARREAAGAFGDDTVFLERYVDEPRHVEIQIFGDTHGTLVHLFERECSIQRRHQKIIEEAPSPAVTPLLRELMGAAAVSAGAAIGYVGAGTVEFILAPGGDFFFLEVNTRLQVEHPVTEAVTGLDLVALQLAVAEGAPLPERALHPTITGHAVEARLYAEDPLADFLPATGVLRRFDVGGATDAGGGTGGGGTGAGGGTGGGGTGLGGTGGGGAGGGGTGGGGTGLGGTGVGPGPAVRVDSGVRAGDAVSVNYDPMLAKVTAYGPDRAAAVRLLAGALRRARIHGVTTNRDLLVGVLEHPEFAEGRIDTHFLDRHPPVELAPGVGDPTELGWYALAAALCGQEARRRSATVWAPAPSGWRNNPAALQTRTYTVGTATVAVGYALGPGGRVEIDGVGVDVGIGEVTPTGAELTVGGVRRRFAVAADTTGDATAPGGGRDGTSGGGVAGTSDGGVVWVDSLRGGVRLVEAPRFPEAASALAAGSLVAPMPGIVVRVDVAEGERVTRGQALLVLEAMKMEHAVTAPADGAVTAVNVKVGLGVDAGAVLVVIEDDGADGGKGMTVDVTTYEVRNGVAWLTMNRPDAANALNADLRAALGEGFGRFAADGSAAVLVLTGAGDRAFSAGGDLKEMAADGLRVPPVDFVPQPGEDLSLDKPVLAAVNGVAYGGGFLLAQSCDLCIAASHARFAITEARWGRGSPWAAPLPWLVPPRVAMELVLTAQPIDAARALEVGLVNRVVPGPDLVDAAQAMAETVAANAPLSVRAGKAMVYAAAGRRREEAWEEAEELFRSAYLSADALEGPRAFRERRPPVWQGR